ncbi:hypothetical protein [Saliterribacillus persicus]|uniref:Uncharacterized protein n=1 Tax=Saliterribacillus persicus TaxID=930114 RepID=A0A368YA11_9BACI|nr:hypothetical protein [Saliterribacillus persicus]RCW77042.1 hypothetical protein DFR57_102318 [Saliterribacillus persicus]
MKTVIKIIIMVIYMFLLSYLPSVYDVPKDTLYIVVFFPLGIGGILLIDYLFKDKDKTKPQ